MFCCNRLKNRCLALLLLLPAAWAGPATADEVASAAEAYVSEQGFEAVDLDTVSLVERLDAALADTGLARRDADVTALEKALLLVDLEEKPLPRLRYAVRLGIRILEGVPVSFVEVDRYNLGPAVRAETIEAYGAENTADAETFGTGPHVGWRFVMQPAAKAAAILLAAGRREIPQQEAEAASCFGRTCLSLDLVDELKPWREIAAPAFELPAMPYPAITASGEGDERIEEETPAHVALELALALGLAKADAQGVSWTAGPAQGFGAESPFLAAAIDRNAGQEIMTDAIMGVAKTDKDTGERWLRRTGGVFEGEANVQFWAAEGPM